jgi:hypothetical protein
VRRDSTTPRQYVPRSARIWSRSTLKIRKVFMKFVNFKTKRTHRQATVDQRPRPIAASHQIHSYAELREQIHEDLRVQHPEWVLPNGDCPMCDAYETRLMELLETSTSGDSSDAIVALHRALEHGLN